MRRNKYRRSKLEGWQKCCSALFYTIFVHSIIFFVYYTMYQSNKQAYEDHYYPPQSTDANSNSSSQPAIFETDAVSDVDSPVPESCLSDTDALSSVIEFQSTSAISSQSGVESVDDDPLRDLLSSSWLNALRNMEICKFFSKPANKIKKKRFPGDRPSVRVLSYNDGGYTWHSIGNMLSNVFQTDYEVVDIYAFMHTLKQCPNIEKHEKVIFAIRNPFHAISTHVGMFHALQSSRSSQQNNALNDTLLPLANYWCDAEMFQSMNVKKEATKWKTLVEFVWNEYLPVFGGDNILTIQLEHLTQKTEINDSDDSMDDLWRIFEQYFKIGRFLLHNNDAKVKEQKIGWITKIVCDIEANKQLLEALRSVAINEQAALQHMDCDIWSTVQNIASLYQYVPSTADNDCI